VTNLGLGAPLAKQVGIPMLVVNIQLGKLRRVFPGRRWTIWPGTTRYPKSVRLVTSVLSVCARVFLCGNENHNFVKCHSGDWPVNVTQRGKAKNLESHYNIGSGSSI